MTDPDLPHVIAGAIADAIADALPPAATYANLARYEAIGAALRRGWESASPDKTPAPIYADPRQRLDVPLTTPPAGSGYATEIALRARIAELEAEIAGMRVQSEGRGDECLTRDGTSYCIYPYPMGAHVRLAKGNHMLSAYIRRADMLAVLGFRSDL